MNTTTLRKLALATPRPLSDAYTELLLQGAQANPSFGTIVLCREHDDDTAQPLHRGSINVLYTLSGTVDDESIVSLTDSLRELYVASWLTLTQVKTLLELAARPEDLMFSEIQARSLSLASDGSAQVEAYGARIRYECDRWSITGRDGQLLENCLRLESALQHARLLQRFALRDR